MFLSFLFDVSCVVFIIHPCLCVCKFTSCLCFPPVLYHPFRPDSFYLCLVIWPSLCIVFLYFGASSTLHSTMCETSHCFPLDYLCLLGFLFVFCLLFWLCLPVLDCFPGFWQLPASVSCILWLLVNKQKVSPPLASSWIPGFLACTVLTEIYSLFNVQKENSWQISRQLLFRD